MFLSTKVAAIEFDGDTVRIVVVKVGGRLPVLLELYEATAAYDAPEQRFEALVNAVDAAVGQLRSHPAAFVLCASTTYSVVRTLRVGLKGRRRVAAAVPFELEPYLAFPIDDLLVDFTVVAERGGETEVLAVGSRRELLDEQLAILEAAGVEAEAVVSIAPGVAVKAALTPVNESDHDGDSIANAPSASLPAMERSSGTPAFEPNVPRT